MVIIRSLLKFIVAVFLSINVVIPQTVVYDKRGAGIVDRAIILPEREFSSRKIEQVAKDFLHENSKGTVLLRLAMGVDQSELAASLVNPTLQTYSDVVDAIKKVGLPQKPVARVLAFRGGALLSYRRGSEFREKVLVGSSDPTRFHLLETDFRLLHFGLSSSEAVLRPEYRYSLRLFVQVSPRMSISSCIAATRWLEQLTKVHFLSVVFRRDVWFIGPQYPAVFPFVEHIRLPNESEHRLAPAVGCTYSEGQVGCSGTNFRP